MRLAIVTTNHHYPWGGAEHLWHALALAARARNWPVLAVAGPLTLDSTPIQQLRAAGVEIASLPPPRPAGGGRLARWHRFKHRWLGGRTGAATVLRRFAPDLLFVNQCGSFDGAWEYWLQGVIRSQKIPYVTISHSNDLNPLSPFDRAACLAWCRAARALYFVSTELRGMAEAQLEHIIPQAAVAQNPFPIPPEEALPPWPPAPPWRLAVVGRLEMHEKGIDLILAGVTRALAHEPDWEMNFFGGGPDETVLRDAIVKSGLGNRVHVAGYAANPMHIWRDHHLCILASRWEGFSLVMAEALASGRPVLRTRLGGAGWIEHNTTGWLCDPDNSAAFTNTLRAAWERRADWAQMGAQARHALVRKADPAPVATLLSHLATLC